MISRVYWVKKNKWLKTRFLDQKIISLNFSASTMVVIWTNIDNMLFDFFFQKNLGQTTINIFQKIRATRWPDLVATNLFLLLLVFLLISLFF
jgi:hypothetical protein